jgi:hypothetical protein
MLLSQWVTAIIKKTPSMTLDKALFMTQHYRVRKNGFRRGVTDSINVLQ